MDGTTISAWVVCRVLLPCLFTLVVVFFSKNFWNLAQECDIFNADPSHYKIVFFVGTFEFGGFLFRCLHER